MTGDQGDRRAGFGFGLAAYLVWGVLPLYFKLLAGVPPIEIVANRILWSLIFLALAGHALAALGGGARGARLGADPAHPHAHRDAHRRQLADLRLGGGAGPCPGDQPRLLSEPPVQRPARRRLLKERLSRAQAGAVLLAAAGVAVLAWGAASGLWISLSLAFSFGLYGFVRKIAPVDALEGLSVETALLAPPSLAFLLWAHGGAGGLAAFDTATELLLVLGGAVTAIPLLLFNAAAKRLPYSTLGFLQYLAPSLQFLLAVLVFGEPFTAAHALCFGAIWSALAIFAAEGLRLGRARARAAAVDVLEPCP